MALLHGDRIALWSYQKSPFVPPPLQHPNVILQLNPVFPLYHTKVHFAWGEWVCRSGGFLWIRKDLLPCSGISLWGIEGSTGTTPFFCATSLDLIPFPPPTLFGSKGLQEPLPDHKQGCSSLPIATLSTRLSILPDTGLWLPEGSLCWRNACSTSENTNRIGLLYSFFKGIEFL